MIFRVTVTADAINEEVILAADSEQEARAMALQSALARWRDTALVEVQAAPEGARLSDKP